VWCSVVQCVAVCCSVMQCGAVCCSVLQCVAVCCCVVQCCAVSCSVMQCDAVCCIHTSQTKHVSSCILPDGLGGHESPILSHLSGASLNDPKRTRDLAIFFLSLSLSLPLPLPLLFCNRGHPWQKRESLAKKGIPQGMPPPYKRQALLQKGASFNHMIFFSCVGLFPVCGALLHKRPAVLRSLLIVAIP